MKPIKVQFLAFLGLLMLGYRSYAQEEIDGSAIFATNCAACHTIGQGKLVGPDLKGVTEKYDKHWIYRFIRESQVMIEEGDEKAVAVFNDTSMIPMPPIPLSEEKIDALLEHIAKESKNEPGVEPVIAKKKVNTVPKKMQKAKSLQADEQREATKRALMTGLWIAMGAGAVMIVGIWFAFKK